MDHLEEFDIYNLEKINHDDIQKNMDILEKRADNILGTSADNIVSPQIASSVCGEQNLLSHSLASSMGMSADSSSYTENLDDEYIDISAINYTSDEIQKDMFGSDSYLNQTFDRWQKPSIKDIIDIKTSTMDNINIEHNKLLLDRTKKINDNIMNCNGNDRMIKILKTIFCLSDKECDDYCGGKIVGGDFIGDYTEQNEDIKILDTYKKLTRETNVMKIIHKFKIIKYMYVNTFKMDIPDQLYKLFRRILFDNTSLDNDGNLIMWDTPIHLIYLFGENKYAYVCAMIILRELYINTVEYRKSKHFEISMRQLIFNSLYDGGKKSRKCKILFMQEIDRLYFTLCHDIKCAVCNKDLDDTIKNLRCERCKFFYYCSTECEEKNSKSHRICELVTKTDVEADEYFMRNTILKKYCNYCGMIPNSELIKCKKCKRVEYCSKRCQVKDKTAHKQICCSK